MLVLQNQLREIWSNMRHLHLIHNINSMLHWRSRTHSEKLKLSSLDHLLIHVQLINLLIKLINLSVYWKCNWNFSTFGTEIWKYYFQFLFSSFVASNIQCAVMIDWLFISFLLFLCNAEFCLMDIWADFWWWIEHEERCSTSTIQTDGNAAMEGINRRGHAFFWIIKHVIRCLWCVTCSKVALERLYVNVNL